MNIVRRHMPWRRLGLADLVVALLLFATLYWVIQTGAAMAVPFDPAVPQTELDLSPQQLPYYAGRSLLRMFAAFVAAVLFTYVYGYIAAKYKRAEGFMIAVLDILQSVPVLGFLSVTVTFFIGLFPGSLLGIEFASIFAIFTSQVWNMTFSFYHSVITVPGELQEAGDMFRLNWWERLVRIEGPFAMLGLVWNSMMSFGGGWFFLAASEAISVLNMDVRLPGVGSYLAVALEQENMSAVWAAIATMVIMIVAVDQLFWRPVVAWAQKYKFEDVPPEQEPGSAFLTVLRRSEMIRFITRRLLRPVVRAFHRFMSRLAGKPGTRTAAGQHARRRYWTVIGWAIVAAVLVWAGWWLWIGVQEVAGLGAAALLEAVWLGFLTLIRVLAATVLGALWTVPVGVAIGLSPRLSRIAQPLVQIAASFPANMLFPFVTVLYIAWGVPLGIGSVPLMMLGTQWYILFNVVAAAQALPTDLRQVAALFKLEGRRKWQRLILPGIFPHLITGMITAAGGAWNASIVAELVMWGDKTLVATGLGTDIVRATESGDWPRIIWGITVMALYVVGLNRVLWQRLYRLAEQRFPLG